MYKAENSFGFSWFLFRKETRSDKSFSFADGFRYQIYNIILFQIYKWKKQPNEPTFGKNVYSQGEIFVGRYRIINAIAEGAFGVIHQAEMISTNPPVQQNVGGRGNNVAIKILKVPYQLADAKEFANEVGILKHLESVSHGGLFPKFVECNIEPYGIPPPSVHPYLVIEMLGPDLAKIVARAPIDGAKRFSKSSSVVIFDTLVKAIRVLNASDIVHRDLKPPNILVSANDPKRLVIIDYGNAKKLRRENGILAADPPTRQYYGTVQYNSVAAQEGRVTGTVDDLYGALFIAIEFWAGELPWNITANNNELLELKREALATESVFEGLPKQFREIGAYLKDKNWDAAIDFDHLLKLTDQLKKEFGGDQQAFVFDWQDEFKKLKMASEFTRFGP